MAKRILAVSQRPSNPVSHLAHLFHRALEARRNLSHHFSTDYMQQLHTLVGLSFTAMLTDEGKIRSCRPSLVVFLRYSNLIHSKKFEELAAAIAEITCSAFDSFKALGFPRYYDDFLLAMTHAASSSEIVSEETKNGIHEILLKLLG